MEFLDNWATCNTLQVNEKNFYKCNTTPYNHNTLKDVAFFTWWTGCFLDKIGTYILKVISSLMRFIHTYIKHK
jgi:hypothetical protein